MKKIKKLIVALILGLFFHFSLNVGAVDDNPNPTTLQVGQVWQWMSAPRFDGTYPYTFNFISNGQEFSLMLLDFNPKNGSTIKYIEEDSTQLNVFVEGSSGSNSWPSGNVYKTFQIITLPDNTTGNPALLNILDNYAMYIGIEPIPTTPVNYEVQFNSNGATSGTSPGIFDFEAGTTLNLQDYLDVDLQKTGYTFKGWNTDPNATEPLATITITNNVVLYAVWEEIPIYYEVTWNSNGATSGALPPLIDKLAGSTLNLANYNPGNLAREKYRFLGWNTSPTATTALNSLIVNDRIILYAIWERVAPWEATIVIQGIGSPEYNGEISFVNNTFNFILDWRNSFLPTLTFDNVTTGQLTSINGNVVNMFENTLILPLNSYTYTIALNSLQVQVSKIGESGYIYNKRYIYINEDDGIGMVEQPYGKILTFTEFENTFTGSPQLEPLGENYKITISISFDKAKIQDSETNWENFTDITKNMWDLMQGFLNLKIAFVTVGNILGMVIGFAIIGFIIKIWLGSGNNG